MAYNNNNRNANLQSQWIETHNLQHAAAFHSVCNPWPAGNGCGILSTLQILEKQRNISAQCYRIKQQRVMS